MHRSQHDDVSSKDDGLPLGSETFGLAKGNLEGGQEPWSAVLSPKDRIGMRDLESRDHDAAKATGLLKFIGWNTRRVSESIGKSIRFTVLDGTECLKTKPRGCTIVHRDPG